MVTVIDLGMGNPGSVVNMLQRIGVPATRVNSPDAWLPGEPLILPGVGAYDEGMRRLESSGWLALLRNAPVDTNLLGICLGMQLLGTGSEEGSLSGIGRLDVHFRRFSGGVRLPHMGWNRVVGSVDPIWGAAPELRYYFAHSYYAECATPSLEIGRAEYGEPFTAAVRMGNTVGVQFHPEKSHRFGMELLSRWYDSCS